MIQINLMKNKLKLSVMSKSFLKKQVYMCKKFFKVKNIGHLLLKREVRT